MTSLLKISSYVARAIALIFVSACPLFCWAADDAAKLRSVVDAVIRPVIAEYGIPGIAVAVTVNGKAIFFNYGVAARQSNTPVSEATVFEIGSISKVFTATLAAYAQALGQLSLDDHPSTYLPQLKGTAIDKASLLNLATYTAGGLPLQFPDDVSKDRATDYFVQWKPSALAGAQRVYSNPSIGLFGHITALALKLDFADAIETQLLPKLGLNHSYISVPAREMRNYAWGHNKANQPIRVSPGVLDAQAYGVKSTPADMIRFVQLNIDPSKLELKIQRAVKTTQVGYFKLAAMVQGLGWEQYPYPVSVEQLLLGNGKAMIFDANAATLVATPQAPSGATLFNKTGSTGGFGSYVAFVPDKKIGVVIMANRDFPIPARINAAHAILQQLAAAAK